MVWTAYLFSNSIYWRKDFNVFFKRTSLIIFDFVYRMINYTTSPHKNRQMRGESQVSEGIFFYPSNLRSISALYFAFSISVRRDTEGFTKCLRRRSSLSVPERSNFLLYFFNALSIDGLSFTSIINIL